MKARFLSRALRDATVGSVLLVVALLIILTHRPPDEDGGQAREPPIPPTPVLEDRRAPARPVAIAAAAPKRPPAAARGGADPQEDQDDDDEAAREKQREEDRDRRRDARAESESLRRYAELLPAPDRESFRVLVNKFEWASELGLGRPENLEGEFFNRAFFEAGGWGRQPAFHRAWVYLLRALGVKLDAAVEQSVAAAARELYEEGYREIRALETQAFGAPLEGGDPRDWEGGLPEMPLLREVWEVRNDMSLDLYVKFLGRIDALLPPGDQIRLQSFLNRFNLKS